MTAEMCQKSKVKRAKGSVRWRNKASQLRGRESGAAEHIIRRVIRSILTERGTTYRHSGSG